MSRNQELQRLRGLKALDKHLVIGKILIRAQFRTVAVLEGGSRA
jgi:hypothetical protein